MMHVRVYEYIGDRGSDLFMSLIVSKFLMFSQTVNKDMVLSLHPIEQKDVDTIVV